MPQKIDSLERFVALRAALEKERAALERRLREIDNALGSPRPMLPRFPQRGPAPVVAPPKPTSAKPAVKNKMSIREAVTKATAKHSLKIREIVDAVEKMGYRFQSNNPINSVGAYLYGPEGKKHFRRVDGKFSAK